MTPILFYDTETTGLPDWKSPSDSPEQPHIVQLAAILADQDTQKIISSMDVIIRPDGWEITEAYEHFTGNVLEGAHNAMVDTMACMEIYWSIMGCKAAA